MDNKQFTFRRYIESDADAIYQAYANYAWSNIQPYFSGPCVVKEKSEFIEKFQNFAHKHYRPPIIANSENIPCGVYRIDYNRANRYNELSIHVFTNCFAYFLSSGVLTPITVSYSTVGINLL